jgi:threonine/homoserine/homoserine lactone efflux protein
MHTSAPNAKYAQQTGGRGQIPISCRPLSSLNLERYSLGIPFLVKGVLIGLSITAPLGPIGLLCLNRTHAAGPLLGFICGLGAAAAEALQALAGMIALAAIALWIIDDPVALQALGGVFLVYLGARTFLRPPVILPPVSRGPPLQPPGLSQGAQAAFLASFRLTVANPVTVLGFAAMFAGLGAIPGRLIGADIAATVLVLGVLLGSILWWLVLSGLSVRFRHHIGTHTLTLINRLCGTVLTAFGLYAIAALLPLL